jgi:hypothetical protein
LLNPSLHLFAIILAAGLNCDQLLHQFNVLSAIVWRNRLLPLI